MEIATDGYSLGTSQIERNLEYLLRRARERVGQTRCYDAALDQRATHSLLQYINSPSHCKSPWLGSPLSPRFAL
jgi:hypothetical protein